MALTQEQQADIELTEIRESGRRNHEKEMETLRKETALAVSEAQQTTQTQIQAKQIKLEAIRLAKETLIENSRSKPVDSREVTVNDIQSFANTLVSYINN